MEILVDINGDALHASVGLPPALNVTSAKVGKLEIIVSYQFLNFTILIEIVLSKILSCCMIEHLGKRLRRVKIKYV